MGIAKLYGQKASGININGIIKDYHAYAGENISAGDLVEYINGIGSYETITSEPVEISLDSASGYRAKAIALTEEKVFVARSDYYTSTTFNISCLIITISNGQIILGTEYSLYPTYATSGGKTFVMCKLDESKVYLAFEDNDGDTQSIICLVSDTVISFGSKLESSTSGKPHDCKAISSTKVLLLYSYFSSNVVRGVIHTISGSSISAGTYITITSTQYLSTLIVKLELLSDAKFMVIYGYGSTAYLYGIVGKISDTTLSIGTSTQINTTTNSATLYNLIKLSETSVLVVYQYLSSSKYYLYGVLCTISGTSFTVGTAKKITSQTYIGLYNLELLYIQDTRILVLTRYTSSNVSIAFVINVSSSGTITSGTILELDSTNGYSDVNALDGCLLNESNFFTCFSHYDGSASLRGQQFSIDGTTVSNLLTQFQYETQVRKTTTSQFDGIAKEITPTYEYEAVTYTGDRIPKSWRTVVTGTEYVANDGTVLTASSYKSGYEAIKACNNVVSDSEWWGGNSASSDWIQLKFPQPTKINKINLAITSSSSINVYIQGSYNGTSWEDLSRIRDSYSSMSEFSLSNTNFYQYYRIYSTQTSGLKVMEWQTTEYEVQEQRPGKDLVNVYTLLDNLVVNGDFSNGLEGWKITTGSAHPNTHEVVNNELIYTVQGEWTGSTAGIYQTINPIPANHIFYASMNIRGQVLDSSIIRIFVHNSEASGKAGVVNVTSETTKVSFRSDTGIYECSIFKINPQTVKKGDTIAVSNIKLYDLTAEFGVGNEPTKEWCDENL